MTRHVDAEMRAFRRAMKAFVEIPVQYRGSYLRWMVERQSADEAALLKQRTELPESADAVDPVGEKVTG